MGMDVTCDREGWVHLTIGDVNISLMGFLSENWLNFRGGDIKTIRAKLLGLGIEAPGKIET